MCLQDFMENVVVVIRRRLGEGYQVKGKDILKNNGVTKHAVTICREDEAITPCIYIDDLYTRYLEGNADISSAAEGVLNAYREHAAGPGMDLPLFADPGDIITKVHGRLINTEMNCRLLEEIPHRRFLDLSLIYAMRLPQCRATAREIPIRNDYLDILGINETDLYDAVCKKIGDPDDVSLKEMEEVLGAWMGGEAGMGAAGCPMHILTDKDCHNGAVQLLNKTALDLTADHIGTNDLIILPSSIHELIILPADRGKEEPGYLKELADIVRTVNDTEVLEQEILSYHVYRYSRETGEVTIAA